MIRSLRGRLILSHVLPILLLMPLLSLYLFYTLETFFAQKLLQQLSYQANLVLDQIDRGQTLMADRQAAQRFLLPLAQMTAARVMLIDQDGTILASTRPGDAARIGTRHPAPAVAKALSGQRVQGVGPGYTTAVAYVVVPLQSNTEVIGALRLSYEVDDVRAEFRNLRWLILGGVGVTAVLGLALGWGLATTVARPLRQLSAQVEQISGGHYEARVTIQRQDEVGLLAYRFNQMAARLEEAQQARARQLAAISHELARPLTGMRAAIETLHDGADQDVAMRELLFDGVEDELARLQRMTGMLQSLYKRIVQPMQLHQTKVRLSQLIYASVVHFEPLAAEAGITLTVEVSPDLPDIWADQDRLIQVLTNLLDNAFKYTPSGGQVTVRADEMTEGVRLQVTDTGSGIAPEELPYVFQRFYRGDASRPPEKQGMGLGLAICQEIVTAHHGQIWVESRLAAGTAFTLILPK